MTEPASVLIFGRGDLANALHAMAREGKRLRLSASGQLPACLTVGQMLQLIDILRGRRDVPAEIRPLCEIGSGFSPRGAQMFRDVDLALLQPASPIEISFRGFSLSWPGIYQCVAAAVRQLDGAANQKAGRWLRGGLLAANEDVRSQAVAELLALIPRNEDTALARAVIAEARSVRAVLLDGLERLKNELQRPIGLIACPPAYLPDGRQAPSEDGLAEEVGVAAMDLGLPLFQTSQVMARHSGGASKAFDAKLRRFDPEFLHVVVDGLTDFCGQVMSRFVDRSESAVDLTPGSFSYDNKLGHSEVAGTRAMLAASAVRLLPFPFASAMAVASDIDASGRPQIEAYLGEMVGRLGLDFGDSIWLHWLYVPRQARGHALGFFSRRLTTGGEEDTAVFQGTLTFAEAVAEYHKGNVDHFHAFHGRGPRVAILERFRSLGAGRVAFEPQSFQTAGRWACHDFCIFGLCVVGRPGSTIAVRGLRVVDEDGVATDDYGPAPFESPPDGRPWRMFVLVRSPFDRRSVPSLDRVRQIIVELGEGADENDLERLLVCNTFGGLVIDRLTFLREVCNVEISLITEHAACHFRNPVRSEIDDRNLAEHVRAYAGPVEAYTGALLDEAGELVFSTDADRPHSLCRVLPELARELELRFIVPKAADGPFIDEPLNLVSPSPTRSGGGVYWARRVIPNAAEPTEDKPPDFAASRQSTFCRRLARALEDCDSNPGRLWPIYTHLGGVAQGVIPQPYFDPTVMQALQDRVFGISAGAPAASRVWFARASVIYDYALMLRGVGRRVTRPDADTVAIASWRDEVLDKVLPRSPGQLYGLTFYVEDSARARVVLDGEPLETLYRNPPDQTGRPSVTIAESDLRQVLFERLDPTANRPHEAMVAKGAWTWRQAEGGTPSCGRLTCEAAGVASLAIPLHGWRAAGAQAMSLEARRSKGASLGLLLETVDGGRFLFGEPPLVEEPQTTASYAFDRRLLQGGGWRRLTVPFHDLAWAPTARPGGPMPSHPLKALTILCSGRRGAWIDLAGPAFLRPRTTARRPGEERRFCLGGGVPGFKGDEIVHAVPRDHAGEARRTSLDQRGFFFFDRMAPGIYEVWGQSGGDIAHDRRGPLIEVAADTMTLSLETAAPRA